ncbi:MAG: hypothetical protein ACRDNT_16420 [Streptosporangiaceae bacterium]
MLGSEIRLDLRAGRHEGQHLLADAAELPPLGGGVPALARFVQ